MKLDFNILKNQLEGDLFVDNVQRAIYSTDASSYREYPIAVTRPKSKEDIKKIINFARENNTSIIPRGAGTSLAGQVVGNGIVVDIKKYLTKIIEFNEEERWIIIEPGVVLAELNQFLEKYNLQFAPETSTANRCVIGGMLGNNSCGLHSLVYGSVREHIIEVEAILSDGSEVVFKPLTIDEFEKKRLYAENKLERAIYQNIYEILSNKDNQKEIRSNFPKPEVKRRNNGYALDVLLNSEVFTEKGEKFNFCKLLAGSEGTLAFSYRLKLNLIPLPPKHKGLVCAHFHTLEDSFEGNLVALRHNPNAIELMDDILMQCTKENKEQRANRFFIKGDPGAMLMIEFATKTKEDLEKIAQDLEADYKASGLGYHFPLVYGEENIQKVWNLRKAGLGLLSNIPGDKRSVTVIEDTAVAAEDLPAYMKEFGEILEKNGLECVYYAHIATGEIHLRPLLNLKDKNDVDLYYTLAKDVAALVKKYRGSLSGEHGDGRLRGEFIPFMLGEKNYQLIKDLKQVWDPINVMNPGKIVDTPPITSDFRIPLDQYIPRVSTTLDFSNNKGYFRSIEKCNGSGDCLKSKEIGGTMCPTYMATRDEDKTTRGRANTLREFLISGKKENPFDYEEIYQVLDLCISCKACKTECPSNVDMTKLKAEFMQHYYDEHSIPLRTKLIGYLPRLNPLAKSFRGISNTMMNTNIFKKAIGFATKRSIPTLAKTTVNKWHNRNQINPENTIKTVYLFNDEFTNYNDSDIGIKAIMLLTRLGYDVRIPKHKESGRTFLSKGLLRTAKKVVNRNVTLLKDLVSEQTPLIGVEPSAILSFRDEYPDLVDKNLQSASHIIAAHSYMIDEFLANEIDAGNIKQNQFTNEEKEILLHGHCQQKAIASTKATKKVMSFPENYTVKEIPSGCCGMAGSFGYEKEHYELSMQIGEMILFPAVRNAKNKTIAASGTSCRHQIKDGTGKKAVHPVEVLYEALV